MSWQVLQTRTQVEIKTSCGADLENELNGFQREGIVREFGKVMYTLLYSKWIINKALLYST